MRLTRRGLMQAISVAAAAAPSYAQAPAETNPPTADAELEAARQYIRTSAQIVRQVQMPISTEPAIRFVPRS